ncbi:unnamed protein product [Caenorhabditis angaria]|uniref:Uncharacterized protein n=1 Tax=Caenorhabditis angaria TaxID=860376 RepID=A0A9P1IBK7_9PELO|nr:unnamed protein product [Caenorhabditis angaria]
MSRVTRECREKSLERSRMKPFFISDNWNKNQHFFDRGRDIVRENIRTIKSTLPKCQGVRKVPPFCRQSYQANTQVQPLLPMIQSRSKSVDSSISDDSAQFRALFIRGDLHVRILHSGGPGEKPNELQWAKDPTLMKSETICALLAKFSSGISLLDHPYRFVAETGITDLLIALKNHQQLTSVLPQLVRGLRAGFYSFDNEKKKFCLRTLSRIASMDSIGPQLVPFYRQLLPPLRNVRQSRSRSDRVHYDKGRQLEEMITSTLNDLERSGGANALINIKYLLPHYDSCQYM